MTRIRQAYTGRPQALLFLAISYALWASVTVRWIQEFMEQGHPQTALVAAILLLFGLLMGLEPLLTAGSPGRAHAYLLLQLALVMAAVLFFYELDFFALLFIPLAGQATFLFPRRVARAWIAAFLLANLLGQLQQFGWPGALPFIFLYTAGILFVAAFSHMTLRSEKSWRRSETLLSELQDAHHKLRDAHQQLQAYAGQAEELAVAQERNRLARELHDSVAQTLYGLTLQAEAAGRKLSAGQLPQVAEDLRFLATSAQETLQETRLLIFELRPPLLDEVGLAGALRARLDAVERRSGLACDLAIEDTGELAPELETALFRIAQEALNNVLKHAGASKVSISLMPDGDRLRLEIADDGAGFDPESGAAARGYGLQSMRERAEQLGGRLQVDSAPGQGARVIVEVPL